MNTWFTADTHFGHAKIIIHSKRPFANVEEMDRTMIENWNAVVGPKDDVWHLGDFAFRSTHPVGWYVERLNGRIHMVWGNHDDQDARKVPQLFSTTQEVKYLRLNGEKITLYHYAQRVWRNSHHGAWHLYGHSHGSLPILGRSMDVGVDVNNFTPISFEQVRPHMQGDVTLHHPELLENLTDEPLGFPKTAVPTLI